MFSEIEELANISKFIGEDSKLIQASGGNTSMKIDNKLWIKASGKRLKNAYKEKIFTCVDLDSAKDLDSLRLDADALKYLGGGEEIFLKASIETSMHAIINKKVVIHTHPVDIISQTLSKDGQQNIKKKLASYNYCSIKYVKPGIDLALEIKNIQELNPFDILILHNHGLVIAQNDFDSAVNLQNKIINLLKVKERSYKRSNKKLLQTFSSLFESSILPSDEVIHSLATDRINYQLVKNNPAYPDHVVFCGFKPITIDKDKIDELIINKDFREKLNGKNYLIIEEVGVIILSYSEALYEMLKCQAEVFLRIHNSSELSLLKYEDCQELMDWDAEKYRISLENKI